MGQLFCVERSCDAFVQEDDRVHDAIDERTADEMMQNRAALCEQAGKCTLRSIDEVPVETSFVEFAQQGGQNA